MDSPLPSSRREFLGAAAFALAGLAVPSRTAAAEPAKPAKPPGFFSRLLERAQRPLGS